jgi:large subunit ribosomal protein L4
MAALTLKTATGKDTGTIELDDDVFGVQPNVALMHQVVTAQLAARRSGTQSTKTRSDVSGGGRKPYAQKGTGNARQGSIRAPHFVGGGVALGPKPRKYDQKTPKKMVKAALRSALSDRANEDKIVVVDSWGFETPKTKDAKAALDALGITGTVLVVVGRDDAAAALSFRNLPKVQVIGPGELNAYDVLCNEWLIFTKDVLPAGTPVSGEAESTNAESTNAESNQQGICLMKDPRDIIIAPVVSEKSYDLIEQGVYTFKVSTKASKPEIRDAVEAIWGVEVLKVNTLNRPGKRKRTRGTNRIGQRPASKRAIVTLAAGEIPLFEN